MSKTVRLVHQLLVLFIFIIILGSSSSYSASATDNIMVTYQGDDLILSLGALDITISPSYIRKIAHNLHWITGRLRYEITTEEYVTIADQASPISDTTVRTLKNVPNGKRVSLTGMIGSEANGKWLYTQTITFTNDAILDIAYDVQMVLDRGKHHYFYLSNDTTPLTYRDKYLTINYSDDVTVTKFGGIYNSPHYIIFPYDTGNWRVTAGDGISWLELSAWDWSYQIKFVGLNGGFRHLTYDLSQILDLPIWQPASSHKVIAATQSILHVEYENKTNEEIERGVERVAAHADLIQFHTSGGADWIPDFISRFQKYLDTSHQHNLEVAFQTWQYPGSWGEWLDDHPEYIAWKLQSDGSFIEAAHIDGSKCIDITNPQAVSYMANQFQAVLSQIRDLDYIWYDEDNLQWPHAWPNYYESPTYSDASLQYFRSYLVSKYGAAYTNARFPVDERVQITPANQDKLVYTTDNTYWDKWYEWRAVAFANWLNTMSQAASEANIDNPRYKGAIYFCAFEIAWLESGDWNRLSGVDLDLVLDSPYITWLIMEEAGGYDDYSIPEWQIAEGKRIADAHGKNYGTYVLVYHYYTEPMQNIAPERLVEQMRMGLKYDAQMLVAYTDGPLINRMGDPALPSGGDYIGEYDQTLSNLWDSWRFGYMWSLPQLVRPKGESITPVSPFLVWEEVPLAIGYLVQVDDSPDFSSPVISTTIQSISPVYRPPNQALTSDMTYYWRIKARFNINNKDKSGVVRETFEFWGAFSPSWSFTTSSEMSYPTIYLPIVFKDR